MSSDFRFHVATLVAVFLSLGIGILIGTAFVGGRVVDRQTRLIQRLDQNVGALRKETQERLQNEAALRTLLPGLVAGKLAGRRALIVRTGDYAAAAEQAAAALRLAGATVHSVVLPADAWRRRADAPSPTDVPRLARLLAGRAGPADAAGLDTFRDNALVVGDAPDAPVHLVVLVGGAQADTGPADEGGSGDAPSARGGRGEPPLVRKLDTELARAWQSSGIIVAGVEPVEAEVSFMRAYQEADLPTVDNVDRAAGQIALPFALTGEKAAYGVKATADRLLPASLERTDKNPAALTAFSSSP